MYADDIILLAPSISGLQLLLSTCEEEIKFLDMSINAKKSCCLRVGPRCDNSCAHLTTADGCVLSWVTSCRYLGIFLQNSKIFSCSFEHSKSAYYNAFNAIFGKIGRTASEDVVLQLIKAKCLPVLLYGTEACPVKSAALYSFDFCINRIFFKIFKTFDKVVINESRHSFGFFEIKDVINKRKNKFLLKFGANENEICVALREAVSLDIAELAKI